MTTPEEVARQDGYMSSSGSPDFHRHQYRGGGSTKPLSSATPNINPTDSRSEMAAALNECEIRRRYDAVVIASGANNMKFHVEDDESADVEPLCSGSAIRTGTWRRKSLDVYPESWLTGDICEKCIERLNGDE